MTKIKKKKIQHYLGVTHIINGIPAKVAFINNNKAFLVPLENDIQNGLIKACVFAMLDGNGKITLFN